MARQPKRQRIETASRPGPLNDALSDALGGLDTSGLPAGKEQPPSEPASSKAARSGAVRSGAVRSKRGRVVLRREKARRGGKVVVIAHDFESSVRNSEIEELGRRLRKYCGSGGTVHEREIEIQGEQADKVRAFLEGEGFRVVGV